MSVTPNDVRHVAALARVGIDEARLPSLVEELNGILSHMDQLRELSVDDLPPTTEGAPVTWRDDALPPVTLSRPRDAFAPRMRDGFFLVPRLTTHGALGASEDAS
jgi:aspartyl-tRNA(Asn)/glutamyl-tRNA(Gln) amidotransferase subunit C